MQDASLYSIAHLLTTEALWEAFDNLRKNAAAGVDGVTYAEYEEQLVENLCKLHEKLKSKHLPRAAAATDLYRQGGRAQTRPISIPALEDKIVQRATVELLNAIFEQDFLDCSYGFRPGRSAHDALDEVGRVMLPRADGVGSGTGHLFLLRLDCPQATHGDGRADG